MHEIPKEFNWLGFSMMKKSKVARAHPIATSLSSDSRWAKLMLACRMIPIRWLSEMIGSFALLVKLICSRSRPCLGPVRDRAAGKLMIMSIIVQVRIST